MKVVGTQLVHECMHPEYTNIYSNTQNVQTHNRTHEHTLKHTHTNTRTQGCMHARACTNMCTHMLKHVHTCKHTQVEREYLELKANLGAQRMQLEVGCRYWKLNRDSEVV